MSPPEPTLNESRAGYLRPTATPAPARLDQIAYLQRLPPVRSSDNAAGLVLYLLGQAMAVVPFQRIRGGWRCAVVASGRRTAPGNVITATDLDITTALAVDVADPLADLPTATFAAVWQARVLSMDAGTPEVAAVARVLAEQLRHRRTTVAVLDSRVQAHLAEQAGVRLAALPPLLARLVAAGLLQSHPLRVGVGSTVVLTLPDAAHPPPRPTGPGSVWRSTGIYDTRM